MKKETTMSFYNYMMKTYKRKDTSNKDVAYEDSPEADLAGDMKRDRKYYSKEFWTECNKRPFNDQYGLIESHLLMKGACTECLSTFRKCWKEYLTNLI